jgi:hypothetical protein
VAAFVTRNSRWGVGLALAMMPAWLACGGESTRIAAQADNGGAGEGGASDGGASDIIPLKNGIPIGDCRELSEAEQAELGCPAQKPEASSTCDAPEGKTCRYGLSAENGYSKETVFRCRGGSWTGTIEPCGSVCNLAGSNDISFDISECRSRPVTECPYESSDTLAWSAQSQLNEAFERALDACGGANHVEVEFHSGCPSRLSSGMPLSPERAACLSETLASARWRCARQLVCVGYSVLAN